MKVYSDQIPTQQNLKEVTDAFNTQNMFIESQINNLTGSLMSNLNRSRVKLFKISIGILINLIVLNMLIGYLVYIQIKGVI